MTRKIRWGVLGAANIAINKVIPSMQAGKTSEISAIASRELARARRHAKTLGIEKYYGSYNDLISDPEIDAVYIPLPNHLHIEWTKKSAEAGKHVLCEKPIALDAAEVREMIAVRNSAKVKIQEAFMVHVHPMWTEVKRQISSGRIGDLKTILGFFSYSILDRSNIRNILEMGGGGLLDIGCYPIHISRWMFDSEPERVMSSITTDPETGIDKLTSVIMEYPNGTATFTSATQIVPFQTMQFFGTSGRLEVQIPFNIPTDAPTRILIDDGSGLFGEGIESMEFEAADQFTIQGELFSEAIRGDHEQPISLEDSFHNMAVIDAVFRSAETNGWEIPETL